MEGGESERTVRRAKDSDKMIKYHFDGWQARLNESSASRIEISTKLRPKVKIEYCVGM